MTFSRGIRIAPRNGMTDTPTRPAWPWLALIVAFATAYVWWLSLGALRMTAGGEGRRRCGRSHRGVPAARAASSELDRASARRPRPRGFSHGLHDDVDVTATVEHLVDRIVLADELFHPLLVGRRQDETPAGE